MAAAIADKTYPFLLLLVLLLALLLEAADRAALSLAEATKHNIVQEYPNN